MAPSFETGRVSGLENFRRPTRKPGRLGMALVRASAIVTVLVLVFIIGYVMVRGARVMTPGSSWVFEKMGREGDIFPSIAGTVFLTLSSVWSPRPQHRHGILSH